MCIELCQSLTSLLMTLNKKTNQPSLKISQPISVGTKKII